MTSYSPLATCIHLQHSPVRRLSSLHGQQRVAAFVVQRRMDELRALC